MECLERHAKFIMRNQVFKISMISSIFSPSRLSRFAMSRRVNKAPAGFTLSGITSQCMPFFSASWNCLVSFSSSRKTSQGIPSLRSFSARAWYAPAEPSLTQAMATLAYDGSAFTLSRVSRPAMSRSMPMLAPTPLKGYFE